MTRKTKEEIIYGDKEISKNLELTARNAKEYDALLFDYIEKDLRGAND